LGFFDRLRSGSQQWAKTIAVVASPVRLHNVGLVPPKPEPAHAHDEANVKQDTFKIRLAHDSSRTAAARILVEKRYGEKGYAVVGDWGTRPACPENVTLATYKNEEMMGTLTLSFDTGNGLLVDELYKAEVDALRQAGRRVCEFTKLAIDNKRTSKRMLAGLFHISFLYAERIWGYTDIVIEVNPSHVAFYQRMLGFDVIGSERPCLRVNAPAVLLRGDTQWGREMVRKFGGHPELAKEERSLFPYFLSQAEEDRILERLVQG
jgi:hypothetical protein